VLVLKLSDEDKSDFSQVDKGLGDYNGEMTIIKKTSVGNGLSDLQYQQFSRDGFLKIKAFATDEFTQHIVDVVEASLNPATGPLEYEAEVHYPGSPVNRNATGGNTPRRLLNAYTRDAVFREWVSEPRVVDIMKQLIGADKVLLTQNHHNCIMTKLPQFSSKTEWHQDFRYWSFDRPELVNIWLALGDEVVENGGMKFIPGSHKMNFDRGQLDADLFLRQDIAENKELLKTAVELEMKAGDVLFFHCQTFHAAGANTMSTPKYSPVFSYHAADNFPIKGTRSDRLESIDVE